ncbi:MAG: tetratricopeptide repeat protein [Candidatus Latescibacteria bacterium]|nr:tetratricopeptide repeat protein [Candidatus Latescibacterota bacterium]
MDALGRLAADPRRAALLLAGVALLVYLNSLGNAFQYDDKHAIVANPHLGSLRNLPAFFWHPEYFSADPEKAMYRPLLLATLALNHAWSGTQTYSYHLVNVGLHSLCVVLVWALLRQLGRPAGVALLAGLIFALHPLATEPVNYISSRSELLAAALVLGAVWAAWGGRRWLGVALFALALLAKESAIVLPALLLCREYRRGTLRASLAQYLPHAVVALLYLGVVRPFVAKAVFSAPVRSLADQWGTQAKALVYYLKLLVMPTGLSVHHAFEVSSLYSGLALLSLVLVASLALCGRAGGRRAFGLGAGWMLITLAPTSLVPLNILVNEHRLYLPLVGLLIWLSGLDRLPRLPGIWLAWAGIAALLVVQRNAVWRDEGTLWADALAKAPGEVRPYVFLGNHRRSEGRLAESAELLQQAVALEPDNAAARANLGTTYEKMRRYDQAIALYRQLVAEHPEQGELRYNLARNLQLAGQADQARSEYLAIPPATPHFELVLNNLGALQEGAGRPDSAYYYYGQALAQAPELADARNNQQRLLQALPVQAPLLIDQSRAGVVESWCRLVLAQEPRHRDGLFFLAVSLFAQGRYAESIAANQALVQAHPGFGEGRLQLANALESAGRPAEAAPVYQELASGAADPALREVARQRLQHLERRLSQP